MDEPQEIRTPEGGVLVVLPKDEYEALREAAEDVGLARLAHEARAKLARGEDELIPIELHDRLAAGESPVRAWREYRGLTPAALARAAGVSQAELGRIEAGSVEAGFQTMADIARALRLELDDLVTVARGRSGSKTRNSRRK